MKKIIAVALVSCAVILFSCRKKDYPAPATEEKGSISFQLKNVVGADPLVLNDKKYLRGEDTFTVSVYNYYISNIVLTDENGNTFAEPESYHLAIATTPSSLEFSIGDLPPANYQSIQFLIGVDSVRNFSGAQTGALDPKFGMIWDWNTGYIMAKMEGTASSSPIAGNKVSYHIAGFKAPNSAIRKVTLNFPVHASVTAGKTPVVTLKSDLMTWFSAPNFAGFSATPTINVEGVQASKMASNYAEMFTVESVQN